MRVRRKTLWGRISNKGVLDVYKGELDAFCKLHPDRNVIIRIEVQPKEPSEKLKNYWFGYVIKTLQRAIYDSGENLTEEATYDFVRTQCPLFIEEKYENAHWKRRAKEWEELDSAEVVEIISWTIEWAAENYQCIIEDPS